MGVIEKRIEWLEQEMGLGSVEAGLAAMTDAELIDAWIASLKHCALLDPTDTFAELDPARRELARAGKWPELRDLVFMDPRFAPAKNRPEQIS